MALVTRLRRYLDENGVAYEMAVHPERYTSQEVAAASHVSGKMLAKIVMVKTQDGFAMAVLPAACRMGISRVRDLLGDPGASLASEAEFSSLFPDCEAGAEPPFGNLYGIPVFVDDELAACERITFEAGNHHEVVSMRYADFARLVQPQQAEICAHAA